MATTQKTTESHTTDTERSTRFTFFQIAFTSIATGPLVLSGLSLPLFFMASNILHTTPLPPPLTLSQGVFSQCSQ